MALPSGSENLDATITDAIIVAISCVIIAVIFFFFRSRIGMQLLFTLSMLIAGIFFTGGNLLHAFALSLAVLIILVLAYQRFYNQEAEEVASRLFSGGPLLLPSATHVIPVATYNGGRRKKLYIPKTRVGVIIGKGGKTIKHLESQSGAKIDFKDADPNVPNNLVELKGTTSKAVASAERLINQVLAGIATDVFSTNIPNSMAGLIIGNRGFIQNWSGARIQVIPLNPPNDMPTEMTLKIVGAPEQIVSARQCISHLIRSSFGDAG